METRRSPSLSARAHGLSPDHLPRQDEALMPACHQRVRLAVRLDEVSRSSSKAAAEKAWRRHHAEEMGIELSGSDGDADAPDQEGPEPSAPHSYAACLGYPKEGKGGGDLASIGCRFPVLVVDLPI